MDTDHDTIEWIFNPNSSSLLSVRCEQSENKFSFQFSFGSILEHKKDIDILCTALETVSNSTTQCDKQIEFTSPWISDMTCVVEKKDQPKIASPHDLIYFHIIDDSSLPIIFTLTRQTICDFLSERPSFVKSIVNFIESLKTENSIDPFFKRKSQTVSHQNQQIFFSSTLVNLFPTVPYRVFFESSKSSSCQVFLYYTCPSPDDISKNTLINHHFINAKTTGQVFDNDRIGLIQLGKAIDISDPTIKYNIVVTDKLTLNLENMTPWQVTQSIQEIKDHFGSVLVIDVNHRKKTIVISPLNPDQHLIVANLLMDSISLRTITLKMK